MHHLPTLNRLRTASFKFQASTFENQSLFIFHSSVVQSLLPPRGYYNFTVTTLDKTIKVEKERQQLNECPLLFFICNLRALTLEPKGENGLLLYIMLNLSCSLQQDDMGTHHVARLSKGPHNYVTLAPFKSTMQRRK